MICPAQMHHIGRIAKLNLQDLYADFGPLNSLFTFCKMSQAVFLDKDDIIMDSQMGEHSAVCIDPQKPSNVDS